MKLIATKPLVYWREPIGEARAEGRAPSHDGEYVTVLGDPTAMEWIAEGNAGIMASSECTIVDMALQYAPELIEEAIEIERDIWRAIMDRDCDIQGGDAIECGYELTTAAVAKGWAYLQ